MNPLAGLRMGACPGPDNPSQLVMGLATHAGSVVAVGGQGGSLVAVSPDGYALRPVFAPGRGLRGALLREDGLWVVGEYGFIARSTDRGRSWRQLTSGTDGCLFGVVADDDGRLWVAGDDGYLATSADGGTFRRVTGVAESIGRISTGPPGVLVPTDRPGRLYACRDGSVRRLDVEAGVDLMSATVTPTGTVLTVGAGGTVLRSAGGDFERVAVPASVLLTAVRCLPDGRVVVVGADGLVLVSADDGRTFARYEQFVTAATLWCCEPFGDGLLIGDGNGTVAWFGAHRPAAAPAPAATPVERRDGIHVSPWLRAALYPRRGGITVPVRPLSTLDAAWTALRRAFWANDRHGMSITEHRSSIWTYATSDQHHERELGQRILDPRPRTGSAEEDIRLVELVLQQHQTFIAEFREETEDRLTDFLVASVGLPGAARRLLAGLTSQLPYVGAGPFGRLRELLALADGAEYADARTAILDAAAAELQRAADSHRRRAHLRWATTFLLPLGPAAGPEERQAHEDALRHVGEFGNSDAHATGIAAGDLGTLERFLAANRRKGHRFFAPFRRGRLYLASVLELAGSAAGEVLARLKPTDPWETDPYYNDQWCRLLAHLDDDHARAALLRERRAGHLWGTANLLRAASLDPDRIRRFARDNRDDELLALIERGIEPDPVPLPEDDDFAGLGDPVDYVPPPVRRVPPLDTALTVEPVQSWRDEEIAAGQKVGTYETAVTWNGVPLSRCDDTEVEEFVAHRERWAVPTSVADLALAPGRVHDRLLALGFAPGGTTGSALLPVLYRGGLSHLPLLRAALAEPDGVEQALRAAQPFGDVSVVPSVVKAFAGKKHKALGRSWILRHPGHAAAGALTLWSTDRADAGAARVLRYLDAQGHRPTILRFAADLDVEPAARAMLDADPLTAPGAKGPPVPAFAAATTLPALEPALDADLLLTQLAWSNADEVHPGVLAAKAACTPASRAAFAWALFEAWLAAGAPPKASWCLQAVGLLGDDDCARRLTTLARRWPGENASARAHAALDALLNIGTDTALININLLAEKSRFPAFAAAARERIDAIAYNRGLTSDELADRLVPTLGLDEDGADVIDTGARTYRIVFDASLMPVLRDERGAVLPDLPRPGRDDDRALAKAAKAKLTALRKDARASASLHLTRIERAMCTGRAIRAEVFLDRYARHPWMRHLAGRLVWGVADLPGCDFRVAEDGTLADLDDKRYELPPGASVVVRHPLDLAADAVPVWSELFADYEILQPFPQLARPVYRAADAAVALAGVTGHTVSYGQLRGLEARGWQRWHDASVQLAKPLGADTWVILDTDPGWHPSDTAESVVPQRIEGVRFHGGDAADVDPRTRSELIYDLHRLVAAA